jgi:hypothetical protein
MCEATKLTEEKEEEKIYCMVAVHSFGLIKKNLNGLFHAVF